MTTLDDGDLNSIKNLISITFDEKIEEKGLVTKNNIKHLPTKDEFYDREDKIMNELKAVREEITTVSDINRKVNDQEERIENIETKLEIQPAL